MKIAIAKDLDGKTLIRAYQTPSQLSRWARVEVLEIINRDATPKDLAPYATENYTGAAFTGTGTYVSILWNDTDMYRVPEAS